MMNKPAGSLRTSWQLRTSQGRLSPWRDGVRLSFQSVSDQRSKSSVLSEGEYEARVHEGCCPSHFPEVRPHYE